MHLHPLHSLIVTLSQLLLHVISTLHFQSPQYHIGIFVLDLFFDSKKQQCFLCCE